MKKSTIHNPKNFNPQDYKILGYFDNKRPQFYFGMNVDMFNQRLAAWEQAKKKLFGNKSPYRCEHCGNTNVRYVVAAKHIPTGETVCFGDICVDRLNFPDHNTFEKEMIRKRGEASMVREKAFKLASAFCTEHPDVKWAVENIENDVHDNNDFAHNVIEKLFKYGYLTDAQMEWLVKSMKLDIQRAEKKKHITKAGMAPDGRTTVTGKILSLKWYGGYYGETLKMLVELENKSRIFCTVPARDADTGKPLAVTLNVGDVVTVKATFTRKDDPSFSIGKRPAVKKH